jgi:spore maturation protein CgeB
MNERHNSLRVLAITAGPAGKRTGIVEALRDLYHCKVLPGKTVTESRVDRLLWHAGIGNVHRNISRLNENILRESWECDVVFVVKGNFVTAGTLKALRARPRSPRIVGWTCDDIYLEHNNSSILKEAAPYYDVMFTAKSLNIRNRELESMGFRDARYIPQGFDASVQHPRPNPTSMFRNKVVFVGYAEQDRFEKMNFLAQNGVEVHVFGNGWSRRRFLREAHSNLKLHLKPLLGDDYIDALSNSAVSLCFLRKLNRDLHTSRTFEIPACGGFMLGERTEEHLSFFAEGVEAEFFDTADELLEKVRFYLVNAGARARIAEAGYLRTRSSDYSYHRIARKIIQFAFAENSPSPPPAAAPLVTAR